MKLFGLHPDSLTSGTPLADRPLGSSVLLGIVGFGVPSLLVFGSWALHGRWLYGNLGELGAYGVWALLFILGAGVGLRRLVIVPCSLPRFFGLFGASFFLYAAAWTAAWLLLKLDSKPREIIGALAGTGLFALVLCAAFGGLKSFWRCWAGLFVANAAGYFAGDVCYAQFRGHAGKLLWGLCYGAGFGAGLGWAFHTAQAALRERLRNSAASQAAAV